MPAIWEELQSNGFRAKPAREVRPGDKLRIENERGIFEVEVLLVSATRGPAAVAQTLYRESDASREARLHLAAERKAMQQYAPLPQRRPSKRDRRRIIQFRGAASRSRPDATKARLMSGLSLLNRIRLCDQLLDLLFDHFLRHVADDLIGDLAALEEQQRRNAANAVARGVAPF